LGEYLNILVNDESEYEKYFTWKKDGLSPNFMKKYERCGLYNADCRLCKKIKEIRDQETRDTELVVTHSLSFDGVTGFVDIPHR
jgi:hypothetical protein